VAEASAGVSGTTVVRRFPATCDSVRQTRQFLIEQVGGGRREGVELLALMLSELATNAVQAADDTEFEVAITVAPSPEGRTVDVRVTDEAPGFPAPQTPGLDEPHGRGLRIIESLAGAWGVEVQGGRPGKTVWFTARVGPSQAAGVRA
jgi:anti-sigma regulatory factor (Ser/Thr protein kinase)